MTRNRLRPTGFNFAEVLFAVMILGLGFTMVAAIFPVALTQTKTTGEEVVASTVARGAVAQVSQIGALPNTLIETNLLASPPAATAGPVLMIPPIPPPPPPPAEPFPPFYVAGKMISMRDNRLAPAVRDALWQQIAGNLILPDDPRTAYVVFYRRGTTAANNTGGALPFDDANVIKTPDTHAHVVIIGVSSRARSAFDSGKDLRRYPTDEPAASASLTPGSLEGRVVNVKLTEGNAGPDLITFYTGSGAGAARVEEMGASEGAYIVISDDQIPDDPTTLRVTEYNAMNGRVFRLGAKREDLGPGAWELAPDGDLTFINPDNFIGTPDDVSEQVPPRPVADPPQHDPPGLPAIAYMVARGYADPQNPAAGFEGNAQDTAVYVGIIPAN